MSRLLLISAEPTGDRMAGPAIRALELAAAASAHLDAELVAPVGSSLPVGYEVPLRHYDPGRPRSLRGALAGGDVALAPPLAPPLTAAIADAGVAWIADLANPEPFEGLEFGRGLPPVRRRAHEVLRADRIGFAARAARAFICANERQRDMWLGFLAAHRRLNGSDYVSDRTLERLIRVVPNGVPEGAPKPAGRPLIRGVQVPDDARLAIWNGGLWDWLDPLTVIEAIAILRADDPRWALVFLGGGRPGGSRHMTMYRQARGLAEARGLIAERGVYFESGWVPYLERGERLMEADVGVCAHPSSAETRFAARTRLLDLVWARLPIVTTAGDVWSDQVAEEDLGQVAPAGDPHAYAHALRGAAANAADHRRRLDAAAVRLTWRKASEPLARLAAGVAGNPARPGVIARSLLLRHRTAAALARFTGADRG